ncbi:MAG TPA: DnaB-like helicase C-terminal domain-containing protein [Pseudonocardiaceae bacterium]|nr:DnaB-like helicase C-terminal domain-containing protein [Pseudonocardiaceae bacterium]
MAAAGSRRDQHTFAAVRTTADIAATLRCATADARLNHSVTNTRPLVLPERALPITPYLLGVWLGGGHGDAARFTTDDPEILWYLEEDGYRITADGPRTYSIRFPEPPPAAHIPNDYLRASERQRRDLLAGLLDTDGTVTPSGWIRVSVTDRRLARDIYDLVVGLGYRCSMPTDPGAAPSTAFTLTFRTHDDVFRLERKRLVHKERTASAARTTDSRFIVDVRPVPSVPVRCVEVSAADHLYLAGRSMVPTHNSTLGLDFARSCSVKHGMTSVIFSLEMSKTEIVMRMLSAEAKIRLQDMRGGRMSDDDWTRLARRMSEISEAPLYIDDSPNLTMMEIRAKARRLKQRNDLKLIILDYLQLMTSGKRVESRQQEVSEFSRNLKLLAKELEVPVVAISQLNRGPEQRTDKRPQLSDLRESGSLEQDADMVVLLNRPDAWERDDPRAGEADLIIAKHRAGPTSTITVAHQLHYSRFSDLAQT